MIDWLLEQSLFFTCSAILLIILRTPLRNTLGAKGFYFLWSVIPVQLFLSLTVSADYLPQNLQFNTYIVGASNALMQSQKAIVDVAYYTVFFWLLGVLVCGLYIAYQHAKYMNWLKAKPLANAKALHCFTYISAHKLDNIDVKVSSSIRTPMLSGVFKHTLVLPVDFPTFMQSEQVLMLEHEFVHLKHGDLYWNGIALSLLCLFWFNPLAWWAYRHFRQSQELACDADVLANKNTATKKVYANAFLKHSINYQNTLLTTLHYGGIHYMKERIGNIKTGFAFNWLTVPVGLLLLCSSLGYQAIAAVSTDKVKAAAVAPVKRLDPVYPEEALRQGLEGTVVMSFSIELTGMVSDIRVMRSDHNGLFDDSARQALQSWVYHQPKTKLKNQVVALQFVLDESFISRSDNGIEQIRVTAK